MAPVKVGGGKERPVKIITDNSVKTIVFLNTEISQHTATAKCSRLTIVVFINNVKLIITDFYGYTKKFINNVKLIITDFYGYTKKSAPKIINSPCQVCKNATIQY